MQRVALLTLQILLKRSICSNFIRCREDVRLKCDVYAAVMLINKYVTILWPYLYFVYKFPFVQKYNANRNGPRRPTKAIHFVLFSATFDLTPFQNDVQNENGKRSLRMMLLLLLLYVAKAVAPNAAFMLAARCLFKYIELATQHQSDNNSPNLPLFFSYFFLIIFFSFYFFFFLFFEFLFVFCSLCFSLISVYRFVVNAQYLV